MSALTASPGTPRPGAGPSRDTRRRTGATIELDTRQLAKGPAYSRAVYLLVRKPGRGTTGPGTTSRTHLTRRIRPHI